MLSRMMTALVALGLCAGASAGSGAAETIDLGRGTPPYRLFIPSRHAAAAGGSAALVVMLHGCNQDAAAVASGTKWNAVAEDKGFFVLYANQAQGRNPLNCWNWFLPGNQRAGAGEPAEIIAAIDEVETRFPIDKRKVFVAGLSAGGAMAAILLSCYPERFAAGAISSGLPYGIVNGAWEALTVMAHGPGERRLTSPCDPHSFRGGIFVVQGSEDRVVNPRNAERVLRDFVPASATDWQTTQVPANASSLGYQVTRISDRGRLVAERVLVEKADHAWMGGTAGIPYCDARGPAATAMIWAFFATVAREGAPLVAANENTRVLAAR